VISDGVLETAVSARDSLKTGISMSRSRLGLEKSPDSITASNIPINALILGSDWIFEKRTTVQKFSGLRRNFGGIDDSANAEPLQHSAAVANSNSSVDRLSSDFDQLTAIFNKHYI
jgi:hypothetical protein